MLEVIKYISMSHCHCVVCRMITIYFLQVENYLEELNIFQKIYFTEGFRDLFGQHLVLGQTWDRLIWNRQT